MYRRKLCVLMDSMRLIGLEACAVAFGVAIMLGAVTQSQAYPDNHWAVEAGDRLEVLRDFVCFKEGQAGERTEYKGVTFSREVLSAEVYISGFNIWQTKGGDSEVSQIRIDAFVTAIGTPDPDSGVVGAKEFVALKFIYVLKDEDSSGPEDFNDACIGFTVVAKTK